MDGWWSADPVASEPPIQLEPGETVLNLGKPKAPAGQAGNFWSADPVVPSTGESFVRGARQGATGNFGDELSALAAASPIPGHNPDVPNVGAIDVLAGGARLAAEKIAPSVFGTGGSEAYDAALARERAANEAAAEAHPIANIAGQIGGGLAMLPAGAAFGGGIGGAAKAGAAFGGLYGAGAGTDLQSRATGAVGGAGIGAAGGAALGALTRPAGPNAVLEAADRLGVQIPKAVASNVPAVQAAGVGLRNVPFAGQPLRQAAENTLTQLGGAADRVAGEYGGSNAEQAGQAAGTALTDWIGGGSKKIADRLYSSVDAAVAPKGTMPHVLPETQKAVAAILARDANAARPSASPAVQEVAEALRRPDGLTYQGIKDLRSRIGSATSDLLTKNADKGDFDRLYGALTKDLANAVQQAGGKDAVQKWQRANDIYSQISDRRAALSKIVGAKGQASDAQIFDRLLAAAGTRSRANTELLTQARKAAGPDAWKEVAGSVVSRLGRDPQGNFSPDRFITDYGKLSPEGKTLLFKATGQSELARSLDDIATVSGKFKQLQKYANPSGTGHQVGFMAVGAGLWTEPLTTIGTVVGGNILSRILASPATASSAAKWSSAYTVFVAAPSVSTITALKIASRNFGSTVADKLGITGLGDRLMGTVASHATGQQQEAPGPRN